MKAKNLTMGIIKFALSFFVGWIVFLFFFAVFFTPEAEEISKFHTQLSGLFSITITILFVMTTNFNKIFRLREIVKVHLSSIEIEQKKCKKLIDQANDVMNRYMQHEKDTHQNVAKNRSGSVGLNTSNVIESLKSSKDFQGLIEHYPDLKANVGIQQLLDEIVKAENTSSNAKQTYNYAVAEYNLTINSFPLNLVRGFMKLTDIDYYSEPEEAIKIVF